MNHSGQQSTVTAASDMQIDADSTGTTALLTVAPGYTHTHTPTWTRTPFSIYSPTEESHTQIQVNL